MLGVYVVMGCGITAAFIMLIAEIFWKKMTKKPQTKPSCFKRYKVVLIKVRPTGKSSLVSLLFWVGNVKCVKYWRKALYESSKIFIEHALHVARIQLRTQVYLIST